jgi:alkylation response protein AidB-like acyl-CoA dehydrogenase
MDFELREEQKAMRKMMRDFVEKEVIPNVEKWEEMEEFPRGTFEKLADLGLFGMAAPEEFGGNPVDALTSAIIYEELMRGYRGLSYLAVHNLCLSIISRFGNPEQKERWVAKLARGEVFGAFAITEPNAGSDAAAIRTSARREGDDYVLEGSKIFISCGGEADVYTVSAKTDKEKGAKGISVFGVEKGTPGFSAGRTEKKLAMRAYPTRELIFDNCRVPAKNRIGPENEGFRILMSGLDGGRINVGAGAVGNAQAAFDIALQYAKERTQFGQPIANFQAIQFMLADMATEIQAARLLVYHAACLKDQGRPVTLAASMAKRYATDMAMKVTVDAVQILGGYGVMQDYKVERYLREAKIGQIVEGTNQIQRIIIARELLKE